MSSCRTVACFLAMLAMLACFGVARAQSSDELARGAYLVGTEGCGDCHMPFKIGPNGAGPDVSRGLSGHPQDVVLPPPPPPQGLWTGGSAATRTAFYGGYGVSYSANLTPDAQTGIGAWKVDDFVNAMRTGRHLGVGQPILPPMPWRNLGHKTDADLHAMFAYLMAQPPVRNLVPPSVPAPRPAP